MLTAALIGLAVWVLINVILFVTLDKYEHVNVDQSFLALALIVGACVVIQYFGAMLIGVFT